MEYIIEASNDGKKWHRMATFKEGQPSRFGESFNEAIAIKEAESFKIARRKDYMYVRLVIPIN